MPDSWCLPFLKHGRAWCKPIQQWFPCSIWFSNQRCVTKYDCVRDLTKSNRCVTEEKYEMRHFRHTTRVARVCDEVEIWFSVPCQWQQHVLLSHILHILQQRSVGVIHDQAAVLKETNKSVNFKRLMQLLTILFKFTIFPQVVILDKKSCNNFEVALVSLSQMTSFGKASSGRFRKRHE